MALPANLVSQMREASRKILWLGRAMTNKMRLMPDFIIIGAQKCGTTSLYSYLAKHPQISRSFNQEVHFFDVNFQKGLGWYRSQFPSYLYKYYTEKRKRQGLIIGEASPYYIFHPHTPKRVLEVLPQVKLIILLRNPVDRAYSHYHHEKRKGRETLSFAAAVESEQERLSGETEKILENEYHNSFNYRHYSYLTRGIYVDQLRAWMNIFPREQTLILRSESFFCDPPTALQQVFDFLHLPDHKLRGYKKLNQAHYPEMDPIMRRRLLDYFDPHNQRLYEYLGMHFDWSS